MKHWAVMSMLFISLFLDYYISFLFKKNIQINVKFSAPCNSNLLLVTTIHFNTSPSLTWVTDICQGFR